VGAIDAALPNAAETARSGAAEAGRGSGFDAAFGLVGVGVDADADAAAISAGFDGSSAAVFAVAHDDGELAFGARSHNGDVRSGGGSGGCVSEIRSAPAPPASAFVERVDVGFVFFLPLRPGCCHQNSLLWAAIILPSFNERIARRGVRLALLLANHSLESLQTAADLAETAAASFQTAAVPLLQRRRR